MALSLGCCVGRDQMKRVFLRLSPVIIIEEGWYWEREEIGEKREERRGREGGASGGEKGKEGREKKEETMGWTKGKENK